MDELEVLKLKLEHAKLKQVLLETQIQLIQANHQLVKQEINRLEFEIQEKSES